MAVTYTAPTKGAVATYALNGTNASATVTAYDSGTIIGHVQPGGAPQKLVSGVQQRAADLTVDGTVGVTGNYLPSVPSTAGSNLPPTQNAAQAASAGVSLAPEHE